MHYGATLRACMFWPASQRKSPANETEGVILPDPYLKFPDAQCCSSSLGLMSFSVNILSSSKEDKVAKPTLDARCREQCCDYQVLVISIVFWVINLEKEALDLMYSNYMGFFRSQIKNRYISCQNKGNIFKEKRVYLWKKNNVNEMIESVLYHK